MNVLWLNLQKRGRNPAVVAKVDELVGATGADLVFLQETFGGMQPGTLALSGMQALHISSDLSAFAARGYQDRKIHAAEPFALVVFGDGICFLNVHLASDRPRSTRRVQQLSRITEILTEFPGENLAVGGDFNLAPSNADGLTGGKTSTWTGLKERQALSTLIRTHDLWDVLSEVKEFTFERSYKNRLDQFRCDLILCSNSLRPTTCARYLHETRGNTDRFTDHSAILLTLGDS